MYASCLDQPSSSDKTGKRHQTPAPVIERSASFPSVFEQTAPNFPYLPVCDDIQDKNPDHTAAVSCNENGRAEVCLS